MDPCTRPKVSNRRNSYISPKRWLLHGTAPPTLRPRQWSFFVNLDSFKNRVSKDLTRPGVSLHEQRQSLYYCFLQKHDKSVQHTQSGPLLQQGPQSRPGLRYYLVSFYVNVVCVYIYIYVCVLICLLLMHLLCTYLLFIHLHICVHISSYIYIYTHTSIDIYTYMYTYMYAYTYTYIYIYIYIFILHLHIYIYAYTSL